MNKDKGQIYTPHNIVKMMIDMTDYNDNCLCSDVMDICCGDGAFLIELVKRYCKKFLSLNNDKDVLREELQTYIHGIERDSIECNKCILNLNEIVKKYGLSDVKWDIINDDTLNIYKRYENKIDYIFENPPYIRIHNLKDDYNNYKSFSFAKNGMIDAFIIFYEMSFDVLRDDGKMCIITPSSWLTSKAGKVLRQYIYDTKCLTDVIDFGHTQLFDKITTYSLIAKYEKNNNSNTINYHIFDDNKKMFIKRVDYDSCFIDGDIYFSDDEKIQWFKDIRHCTRKDIVVKNGYATLCDIVFINDVDSPYNIPCIKASTGEWKKCFYPYDKDNDIIPFDDLDDDIKNYLNKNKEKLLKRDNHYQWYLFGRNQAINDTYKDKVAINTIIKDIDSIKINDVKSGCGVYSGLYVLNCDVDTIKNALQQDFIDYIKMLGKYKNGGFYTFSSKDLELFLNYMIN